MRSLGLIAAREMRDAWRNRWFVLFTAAFALIAVGLSWLSTTGIVGVGFAGYGRTAASLVNLVLLVVPLMGLVLGTGAVAGERDRGSLVFLLAQPIEPWELIVGKFAGLSAAMASSILLGFGIAAAALRSRGATGPLGPFLAFLALTTLLAMASVSAGMLISTAAGRMSLAAGFGVFLWLALVFLGDLGLMGTSLTLGMSAEALLTAALMNPLTVFKVTALVLIRGGLETLGPAGLLATRTFGAALLPLLVGVLAAWTLLPVGAAAGLLQARRGLG